MDFFDNYLLNPRRHGLIIVGAVIGIVVLFIALMLIFRVPTVKTEPTEEDENALTAQDEESELYLDLQLFDKQKYYESLE